jgi:hypothetical protein
MCPCDRERYHNILGVPGPYPLPLVSWRPGTLASTTGLTPVLSRAIMTRVVVPVPSYLALSA